MPDADRDLYRHILLPASAEPEPYTYPHQVRGSGGETPQRSRANHANQLLDSLDAARSAADSLRARREQAGLRSDQGICLEFESDPGFDLALQSLDRRGDDIELLTAKKVGDTTKAVVLVKPGKLEKLERLVRAYRDEDTRYDKPKNQALVDSIKQVRQAALESFWTDQPDLFPDESTSIWWEVWLRSGQGDVDTEGTFIGLAEELELSLRQWRVEFVDRTVRLVYGPATTLKESVELLDCVAELRRAKENPEFLASLSTVEQREWIDDLLQRTAFAPDPRSVVCVLDTGVTRGHPLLAHSLADEDVRTCYEEWGRFDHWGHGTEMAGLALFGDLAAPLLSREPFSVDHALESVKVLPPQSQPATDPELYGSITQEAVARAEVGNPDRDRVFLLAVTTPDYRDYGAPSSWSAALDQTASAMEDGLKRLLVVSAGNVDRKNWDHYPDRNDVEQIHDPAQAWNVLTVGAMTEKVNLDDHTFPGWTPLARPGGLSPCSTTSVNWDAPWPNKPDLVMEGGNAMMDPSGLVVDTDDSLQLLTTHRNPSLRLLSAVGDTSGAAAQVARMAAILQDRYPELWPETIRALLVHSARWTREMEESVRGLSRGERARVLLRRYGYGVPNLERASWSAQNALTLIAQDDLQPYDKSGSSVTHKEMMFHSLPWPREQLHELAEQTDENVELRVTLSYFVEPNPGRRGWVRKFRYQSHGLRFAMRSPLENQAAFRARISRDFQDEGGGAPEAPADDGWVIGSRVWRRGSIHSDRWIGPAAELVGRGELAVFPVGGWWRERPHLERWQERVRYSLVVSLTAPELGIDLYTPIANQVGVPTTVAVEG